MLKTKNIIVDNVFRLCHNNVYAIFENKIILSQRGAYYGTDLVFKIHANLLITLIDSLVLFLKRLIPYIKSSLRISPVIANYHFQNLLHSYCQLQLVVKVKVLILSLANFLKTLGVTVYGQMLRPFTAVLLPKLGKNCLGKFSNRFYLKLSRLLITVGLRAKSTYGIQCLFMPLMDQKFVCPQQMKSARNLIQKVDFNIAVRGTIPNA